MRTIGALLLSLFAVCAWAETITGRVVAVSDGDTITVLDGENREIKVRLAGIDAPEKDQEGGQEAKQSLSALVVGRVVDVNTSKRDKYGRAVGKVLLDGQDVNLEQIKHGHAWHYKKYAAEQSHEDRSRYAKAESNARQAAVGVWSRSTATPPWEWRHRNDGSAISTDADTGPPRKATARCYSDTPGFCETKSVMSSQTAQAYYEQVRQETGGVGGGGSGNRLSPGDYTTHTGPRGGVYHRSATGGKVYHKR